MRSNGLPPFTPNDVSDHDIGYSEPFPKCIFGKPTRIKQSPNFDDLFSLQLRSSNLLALQWLPASLCPGVCKIHSVSAEEQMIGPYAIWNIAPVQNVQSARNISTMEQPRNAMSKIKAVSDCEYPIAKRKPSASPKPTGVRFLNFRPKTIHGCFATVRPIPEFIGCHGAILNKDWRYYKAPFGAAHSPN